MVANVWPDYLLWSGNVHGYAKSPFIEVASAIFVQLRLWSCGRVRTPWIPSLKSGSSRSDSRRRRINRITSCFLVGEARVKLMAATTNIGDGKYSGVF